MEKAVEEARRAYDDFLAAMEALVEAKAAAGGERTAETDAALEAFGDWYRSFMCSLDGLGAMVEAARQRFTAELGGGFVDEPAAAGRMLPVLERAARAIDFLAADGRSGQSRRSPSGGASDVAASPPVNDHDGKSSDTT